MAEPYWLDPAAIRFKISPHADLGEVAGGDWDRRRRHRLAGLVKHQAIRQRFLDGAAWEDTELFRSVYARRFAAGGAIRGARDMGELLAQYYDRVDGLFEAMKRDGFQLSAGGRDHPLPSLLLGRGAVFIGNQGNHRLAIAQVLKLGRFAGKVICRHPQA